MTRPETLRKRKKQFSSEQNLISPGFHSKSLTAILCWGGCLSALSLLSKVKTGPKWRARHVCASYRILEAGQGRATVGIGAQRDTFPILLDSDRGGTTRPQPQCCILHKIYYILWFQAQANSKIWISHTQRKTRNQNPSKGCASQALLGVKNIGPWRIEWKMVFPSLPSQPSFHLVLINLFANFHSGQLSCKLLFMTIFSKFCKLSFHIDYLQNLQISNPHKSIAYFADCCFGLFFFFYKLLFSTTYLQIAVSHIVLWICELSRQAIFFLLQIVITFLQLGLLYHSFANFEKCHFGQHYTSCSSGQRLLELYTKKLFAMLLQLISHVIFFRCASISWFQVVSKWVNE